jgi:hypothetical protein
MKQDIIKAKIEALEDIKTNSFGISIGESFEGIVEVADIDIEIKRLRSQLEDLNEKETN